MKFRSLAFLAALIFVCSSPIFAQDRWTQVKSKNFYLLGNASEKDIKKVATKLEQFREAFRLLFPSSNLTAPIQTNVVVFKSDSAYKPFKPKRSNGKIDESISGYFQSGEDVNYITLSVGGDERETYGTIFHEYVHFIIDTNFGKSEVPQWFNEGLAEYYQTFEIIDGIKVKLGLPQENHLYLLQKSRLMPLDQLLTVSNRQLIDTGGHSRSIFYAQSWALVHYLTQSGKSDALSAYLAAVIKGIDEKTAFETAFQTTYPKMEEELRRYVSKNSYRYNEAKFKSRLDFDSTMQASQLPEGEANAYLGDLLHHNNRSDEADPYLLNALRADPNSSLANTTLGMVKLKQRKFDEARGYLEKAIAGDQRNHAAYFQYAMVLSRESQDEFGYVKSFDPATARKMRDSLRRAIAVNPSFAESYELFAFVSLVTNEDFDEAERYLKTAIQSHPGNQRYSIRLAEIYARQRKFDGAIEVAERITSRPESDELRSRAAALINNVNQLREFESRQEAEKKRYEVAFAAAGGTSRLVKRIEGVPRPSEEEIAKLQEDERMRSMNESLRGMRAGEKRVLGRIEKIDCKKRPIVFGIRSENETFSLTGRDFTSLTLISLDPAATNTQLGCDANVSAFQALLTYRELGPPKIGIRGELVAIEFVPASFRIMTLDEIRESKLVVWDMEEKKFSSSPVQIPTQEEVDAMRRSALIQGIKASLRKAADGERREIGYLEKVECTDKGAYFHFRTKTRSLKLLSALDQAPDIIVYAPDLAGAEFGCGIRPIEFPAVFIFNDKPALAAKSDGTIVSIEFVPKSFILE